MNGIERIAAERERQVEAEGWTPEHDDAHADGVMAMAAACYAVHGIVSLLDERISVRCVWVGPDNSVIRDAWPWASHWDKRDKHPPLRRLEIAGALIAAEIDRLLAKETKGGEETVVVGMRHLMPPPGEEAWTKHRFMTQEIESCSRCLHLASRYSEERGTKRLLWCQVVNKELQDPEPLYGKHSCLKTPIPIPAWCPLPKRPEVVREGGG